MNFINAIGRSLQPNEKLRWRALYLISSGLRAAEAARRVGRTSGWATQLTQRYNALGVEAVADRRDAERKTGRVPT
ncbi:MAG: helix-turn-helix domain-containing protein [Acidobacteriota bacterium]|nr:helix-turn-helix domain-containing protein [Acidobacteriota bacterium]